MKKVILVAAAVAAGSSIFSKYVSEETFNQAQEMASKLSQSPGYTVSWTKYEKGLFGSQGELSVLIDLAEALPESDSEAEFPVFELKFDVDMQHGPLLYKNGFGFGTLSWEAVLNDQSEFFMSMTTQNSEALYSNIGQMGFMGSVEFTELMPSFTAQIGKNDSDTLQFDGYQSVGKTIGDKLVYQGGLEKIALTSDVFNIDFINLNVDFTYEGDISDSLNGSLYNSDAKFVLGSVNFSGPETVTLKNLAVTGKSVVNETSGNAEMSTVQSIGELTFGEENFTDITIDSTIKNYSAEFNKEYYSFINNINSISPEEAEGAFQNLAVAFLESDPELIINNIGFKTTEGEFTTVSNIKMGTVNPDQLNFMDQTFWINNAIVDFNMVSDKSLANSIAKKIMVNQLQSNPQTAEMETTQIESIAAQQAPMMINNFVTQGLIQETDTQYKFSFQLDSGEALLNDQPFPLQAVMAQGAP